MIKRMKGVTRAGVAEGSSGSSNAEDTRTRSLEKNSSMEKEQEIQSRLDAAYLFSSWVL